jgi:hypothetical protein
MFPQYYFISPTYLDVYQLHIKIIFFYTVSMNKKSFGFVSPNLLNDNN